MQLFYFFADIVKKYFYIPCKRSAVRGCVRQGKLFLNRFGLDRCNSGEKCIFAVVTDYFQFLFEHF